MKKSIYDKNQRFSKYLLPLLISVLLILSLVTPFISINDKNYFLINMTNKLTLGNGYLIAIFIANLSTELVALGSMVFCFIMEKKPMYNKKIAKVLAIINLVTSFLMVISVFCYKLGIEQASVTNNFLLKGLSIGFYALLVASMLSTVLLFRKSRISTGYIVLIVLSIIWIFPLLYIVLTSFRGERTFYSSQFFPKRFTFDNYIRLFTDNTTFYFGRWFANTLIVAVGSCIISTFIIISTSYVLSRFKFKGKKKLLNLFLILGMFPGFMSMIAVYYIIKAIGLNQSLTALILCYSCGSALGYYVVKGFIDTIPRDIDEAAMVEGASKWTIFRKIILPLSKPIIIYTVLVSFMGPWGDYIFSSVILGDNYESYTVALGLHMMLQNEYLTGWYTSFMAGAVVVALPISILFISLNKYYVEGLSGSVKG